MKYERVGKLTVKWTVTALTAAVLSTAAGCGTLLPAVTDQTEIGAAVESSNKSDEELYKDAVKDAMTVESEEILPVVSLAEGEPYAVYSEDKTRLLLFTYHKYPDSYPDGQEVTIDWGDVWTFTGGEMADWFAVNKKELRDPGKRFRQLLGLPADNMATHFTGLWVKPEDIIRPAYVTDITEKSMSDSFISNTDAEYKEWFDDNIIDSYFEGSYPWTRLGYTYDWSFESGSDYGLSEFLIRDGAQVEVAYTCTREEFQGKLDSGSWLSD